MELSKKISGSLRLVSPMSHALKLQTTIKPSSSTITKFVARLEKKNRMKAKMMHCSWEKWSDLLGDLRASICILSIYLIVIHNLRFTILVLFKRYLKLKILMLWKNCSGKIELILTSLVSFYCVLDIVSSVLNLYLFLCFLSTAKFSQYHFKMLIKTADTIVKRDLWIPVKAQPTLSWWDLNWNEFVSKWKVRFTLLIPS